MTSNVASFAAFGRRRTCQALQPSPVRVEAIDRSWGIYTQP